VAAGRGQQVLAGNRVSTALLCGRGVAVCGAACARRLPQGWRLPPLLQRRLDQARPHPAPRRGRLPELPSTGRCALRRRARGRERESGLHHDRRPLSARLAPLQRISAALLERHPAPRALVLLRLLPLTVASAVFTGCSALTVQKKTVFVAQTQY